MTVPVDNVSLQTRMSQLTGLSVLAMFMLDRRQDAEILRLAVTSLTSLGRSRVVATSTASDGSMLRGADGKPLAGHDIGGQLVALDGADGPVSSKPFTRHTTSAWRASLWSRSSRVRRVNQAREGARLPGPGSRPG